VTLYVVCCNCSRGAVMSCQVASRQSSMYIMGSAASDACKQGAAARHIACS
jgi:hypothetical protein